MSTRGQLLLAAPPLVDPTFDRAVVYMLEHSAEGAVGVILNRPTDEAPDGPLDRWMDLLPAPSNVFAGGPVDDEAYIALAILTEQASQRAYERGDTVAQALADSLEFDHEDVEVDDGDAPLDRGAEPHESVDVEIEFEILDDDDDEEDLPYIVVSGTVGSADLSLDPALIAGDLKSVRIFRGYAGWGPGQLESELSESSWIILDAEPEDVVSTSPDELWRDVLRRQPGRLAWLAEVPDDLSVN